MNTQTYTLTDQDFQALAELVYDQTGIVLEEHKKSMLYSRLARRLRSLKLDSFRAYLKHLQTAPERDGEMSNLVNAVTTNLTGFFREAHHFEHLRNTVLPSLLAGGQRERQLRIWSAGCSKGAEPYSIAMVLAQCLEQHPHPDVKILATDIDTDMLAHGRNGIYKAEEMEPVPQAYMHYITPHKKGVQMHETLRKLITFNPLNLLEEWPMKRRFDVIFCRNVIIYFDKQTQRHLFAQMREHIKENGHLYLGHSESLTNISQRFDRIGKTIYKPI